MCKRCTSFNGKLRTKQWQKKVQRWKMEGKGQWQQKNPPIRQHWMHRRKRECFMTKVVSSNDNGQSILLGFCGCSLVRVLPPPLSYSWVWAGEEYLAQEASLASLPTYAAAFVDSTSETIGCLLQTNGAGVGSGEQQHQSRWHSGIFGMEVSPERPCSQWQKEDNYPGSQAF